MTATRGLVRTHRWFLLWALISVAGFAVLVTQGTGRLFERELLADFYDFQARSLVHGRLDVPFEAVRNEAFISNGKFYGYFGLTPALLRIPFVLLGIGFGELSRCFMLIYFAACLSAAYLIYLHAARLVHGRSGPARPISVGVLILNVGLGSSLFFLSSRAYVYHEAILGGAAFALWSVWCSLRYVDAPGSRWWIGAVVCAVLAVHARPTTGLMALATLGFAATGVAVKAWRTKRRAGEVRPAAWKTPVAVAGLVVAGVLSYNAIGFLKFGSFSGCPLPLHIQYTPERLARIDGGKLFRTANIPLSLGVYSFGVPITVGPTFPYVAFEDPPKHLPANYKFDIIEPIAGFPYAMPALLGLALVGTVAAFALARSLRGALLFVWAGGAPMLVAMFAAIAISQRYTADFCPLFAAAAALGLAAFEVLSAKARALVWVAVVPLTALSVTISVALTLRYQGEMVWGANDAARERYLALAQKADALFGVRREQGYDFNDLPVTAIDAENLLFIADVLFKFHRPDEAIAFCRATMQEHPDQAAIRFAVAKRLATQPDLGEATACLEAGLRLKPKETEAPIEFAEVLIRNGRADAAISFLRDVIHRSANSLRAHYDLAVAYTVSQRLPEALREFEAVRRLDPHSVSAAQGIAQVRSEMNKPPPGDPAPLRKAPRQPQG